MVRIVLQFQEEYNGATFETYNCDVSTDRLVENDLRETSEAVARIYRDVLATANIPEDARQQINVFLLQKVLETMGAQDVQDIISIQDYEAVEEPEMPEEPEAVEVAESHVGEKVAAICPLCSFPESILYPDHAGLLVCEGCGKTWDPEIEGRRA